MRGLRTVVLGALVLSGCGGDSDGDNADAAIVAADAPKQNLEGLIASWDFNEGDGVTVFDTSGVEPLLDLEIFDFNNVSWEPDLLRFKDPTIARTVGPATKIIDAVLASNELTLELWIRVDIADQSTATVFSIGRDGGQHNLWAGTTGLKYESRIRVPDGDNNGNSHTTEDLVDTELTHIVHTCSPTLRRIYVDAVFSTEKTDPLGDFQSWDPTFRMSFGGEPNLDGNRDWLGEIHRIAIYDRFFSAQDVFDSEARGPTL